MQLDSAKIDIGKLAAGFQAPIPTTRGVPARRVVERDDGTWSAPRGADRRRAVRLRPDRSAPRPDPDRTAGSGAKLRLARSSFDHKDNDVEKRASLLRRDSIHGPFSGTVIADEENDQIIVNGNPIKLIYAPQPEDIDPHRLRDQARSSSTTPAWRDMNGLSRHLQANGASLPCSPPPGRAR